MRVFVCVCVRECVRIIQEKEMNAGDLIVYTMAVLPEGEMLFFLY